MKTDHVFLHTAYHKTGNVISALRTTSKGDSIHAYLGLDGVRIGQSNLADLVDVIGLGIKPLVIVSLDPVRLRKDYRNVFADGDDSTWLDLNQLAWPLVMSGVLNPDPTLRQMAKEFDVTYHDDIPVTMSRVYWAMMTRYRGSLLAEGVIRDVGGAPLASVRRFFGV